ncbi:MAG: TPM domain-containing protein, partial [Muribaculaceae bacterium]|nr:TPM domain-containing protein [Muribaculaceae bacterium]
HEARIEVGSGAEGVMTDIAAGKIMRNAFVPAMKEGNLNQAVSQTVDMTCEALSDPNVAEELRSNRTDGSMTEIKAIDGEVILAFLITVAVCVFLFALALFLIDFFNARKRDNYRRAMTWRPHLPIYWWSALFSCGLALPLALIARHLYRHARYVPEICDTCGATMQRLPEDKDNDYLTPSQDFEERLGTVDYDVWLCPECGTVERFPYEEQQLKYQRCPHCNTIAMNLVMDKTVDPPTVKHDGHGERIYQCQFCRHTRREGYRIPKKPDQAAAALAAGAAAGMLRGGSRGGGGGFTGGFGGGHSSGGGATGRW